jgi:diketogulonate reductase-like aldo/keto reductase
MARGARCRKLTAGKVRAIGVSNATRPTDGHHCLQRIKPVVNQMKSIRSSSKRSVAVMRDLGVQAEA